MFNSPWPWLIAGLIIAGLEIFVPGVLLLWVGIGALLIGLLMVVLPDLPATWQLLIFSAAMLGSVGVGVTLQRKSRSDDSAAHLHRELDGLVGRRCTAATAFAAGAGRVRVGDTTYAAVSDDDIEAEMLVVVTAIESGRLRVSRHQNGT